MYKYCLCLNVLFIGVFHKNRKMPCKPFTASIIISIALRFTCQRRKICLGTPQVEPSSSFSSPDCWLKSIVGEIDFKWNEICMINDSETPISGEILPFQNMILWLWKKSCFPVKSCQTDSTYSRVNGMWKIFLVCKKEEKINENLIPFSLFSKNLWDVKDRSNKIECLAFLLSAHYTH